jgi:hypothetical protein
MKALMMALGVAGLTSSPYVFFLGHLKNGKEGKCPRRPQEALGVVREKFDVAVNCQDFFLEASF